MVQQPAHSIIAELEDAVRGGSSARRVETLRQVTDLFLNDGERLSDDQVKVFDDVLCLLIARVETRARAELSKRLAPLDYAPFEVIQHLAWDDEIAVAGERARPIPTASAPKRWSRSPASRDRTICSRFPARDNLPEAVTDVIVDRGETKVIRRLANNANARFSEAGLFRPSSPTPRRRRTGRDPRPSPRSSRQIPARPVAPRQGRRPRPAAGARAARAPGRDPAGDRRHRARRYRLRAGIFGVAEELVKLMKELKELDDAAVYNFAEAEEVRRGHGLARGAQRRAGRNDGPADRRPRADLILIPCRSARLNWPTVESILRNRPVRLPDRRSDAGGRGARLPETVDGDRPAHRALLAASQQDREVAVARSA